MTGQSKKGYWSIVLEWLSRASVFHKQTRPIDSPADYTKKIRDQARVIVAERRKILAALDMEPPEEVGQATMGIAFSGGGIRSATISLGISQALARAGRLVDFDYCSTVSGGGYFGSFLGSLFLPAGARGPNAQVGSLGAEVQADFALKVLRDKSSETTTTIDNNNHISASGQQALYRHPIRWLREHSRYLAPNGASDVLAGAAYLIRNWIAMIYVLALPIALSTMILIAISLGLSSNSPTNLIYQQSRLAASIIAEKQACTHYHRSQATHLEDILYLEPSFPAQEKCKDARPQPLGILLSPLWLLAAASAFLGIAAGLAYWLTEYLSDRGSRFIAKLAHELEPTRFRWLAKLCCALASSRSKLVGAIGVTAGLGGLLLAAWLWLRTGRLWLNSNTFVFHPLDIFVFSGFLLTFLCCLFCTLGASYILLFKPAAMKHGDAFTSEIRRILTRRNADFLRGFLIFSAVALVDTLGKTVYAWIVYLGDRNQGGMPFWSGIPVLLAPLGAWIINKLPSWFKDGEGKLGKLIGKYIWTFALLAGVSLFGVLAVTIHVGLQYLLFEGHQWALPHVALTNAGMKCILDVSFTLPVLFCAIALLFRITGASQGFINLSSLHGIYAARLTRAYLGGSNLDRLELKNGNNGEPRISSRSIMESDPGDQIPIDVYQRTRTAAPLHLINVTLNETVSDEKSQLLERDRKGVPLVFAPEGVFVETAKLVTPRSHFSWDEIKAHGVENLSVGQLCAISGAAASTAMGARTTLGGALALSFANIRLGYWWNVKDLIKEADGKLPGLLGWGGRFLSWLLGLTTYLYLLREIWAQYRRDTPYINISDGGHFDNSGAYELLRRNVRTIVVSDNGADPKYVFEDLENLIRKARIDLGMSIVVAERGEVDTLLGKEGAGLFLNGSDEDWRRRAAAHSADAEAAMPIDPAFCLLLKIYQRHWNGQKFLDEEMHTGHIIWMKPRLFEGLPADVTGYANGHRQFPHETTGDQFFDEAQWESYRALGYGMMHQLLTVPYSKVDTFREINRPKNVQLVVEP